MKFINIKKKALKFVFKLDKKDREKLEKALLLLKEDPDLTAYGMREV